MQISEIAAARKTYKDYVDISKFTGMEVEHQHDTTNHLEHENELHANPLTVNNYRRRVDELQRDI